MNQFSHNYYNNLWSVAQAEFRLILADEKQLMLEDGRFIPSTNRQSFLEWLAENYFQYLNVYKKFDEIYDQMVHPQKRPIVRQLLDLTLARLLEYQEVMVGTELSEYLYYEDILNIYKHFPEHTELPVPKYYYYERSPDVELRKRLLEHVLEDRKMEAKVQSDAIESERMERIKTSMKSLDSYKHDDDHDEDDEFQPKELILTIQTIERQRQGMLKFVMTLYRLDEQERGEAREKRQKELENVDRDAAALIVQKLVRGFLARKRVQHLRERELIFLGLQAGPFEPNDERSLARVQAKQSTVTIEEEKTNRRKLQRVYKEKYEKAQTQLESKVRMLESAELLEKMKYSMRRWLLEVRETKGKLPDLPKAADFIGADGKSRLFFDNKGMEGGPVFSDEKKKKGKKGDKEKKQKEKDKKKKKKIKKPLIPIKLEAASQLEDMVKANLAYNRDWRLRNEITNLEQAHDEEMILDEKRQLIGLEVRDQVDALMKAELNHLKSILELRKKKKAKKGKKGKKKGRRGKGRKKKKKKKSKDLTPDRTFESLYEELVIEGIIKKIPKVTFKDLVGTGSLVNETIRKYYIENPNYNQANDEQLPGGGGGEGGEPSAPTNNEKMPIGPNPPPTFGDIKRALIDLCVLPMGSETVHKFAPYTKSIFLSGAPGSGKKSLVYAICNELEATIFDLSPRNLVGKYEGKHGLIMLFHLLEKVGHWCEPMIIMIDMAEMAYMKRVPKTETSEPKRIKKQLSKFIKGLSPEDRMLIFGLSSEPWNAKLKPLKKDYQKFIYIPKPSHGDRLELWKQLLQDHLTQFNSQMSIDVLAKITEGWTLGDIKKAASQALDKHYKGLAIELEEHQKPFKFDPEAYLDGALPFKPVRIGRRQLDMNDFIEELIYIDPLFIEEEKAWNSWFNKTPLMKARLKAQEPPEDETAKKKKKKGKGKGKGSGGKGKKGMKKKITRKKGG